MVNIRCPYSWIKPTYRPTYARAWRLRTVGSSKQTSTSESAATRSTWPAAPRTAGQRNTVRDEPAEDGQTVQALPRSQPRTQGRGPPQEDALQRTQWPRRPGGRRPRPQPTPKTSPPKPRTRAASSPPTWTAGTPCGSYRTCPSSRPTLTRRFTAPLLPPARGCRTEEQTVAALGSLVAGDRASMRDAVTLACGQQRPLKPPDGRTGGNGKAVVPHHLI
ncbi:hypothetical protein ADK82_24205 [Streptomyces sp. NRRL S-4]|nr:hypothetical protein ADK82_24205 [Streptomyces sp. NRRL S-4]